MVERTGHEKTKIALCNDVIPQFIALALDSLHREEQNNFIKNVVYSGD